MEKLDKFKGALMYFALFLNSISGRTLSCIAGMDGVYGFSMNICKIGSFIYFKMISRGIVTCHILQIVKNKDLLKYAFFDKLTFP